MSLLSSFAQAGFTPMLLVLIVVVFIVGGVVKGAIGVGLPLVAVPIMSLVIPSPQAIAMVAVPVLMSNAWQAWDGQLFGWSMKRFWPLVVTLLVATLLTVPFTLALPLRTLNAMLAGAVILSVVLMAFQPRLDISPRRERMASAGVGALSGLLGGVSSLTGPVIICYLMALRLTREQFVGSISVIYLFGAAPLYGSMAIYGRLGTTELLLSAIALLPMWIGMWFGKQLRRHMSETIFRRVLFGFLLAVAIALIFR